MGDGFTPHGSDLFGESADKGHGSTLGDAFLIPPFSVLNAREGWWQERKRAWLALGIQSELGRGGRETDDERDDPTTKANGRPGGLTWGDSPQVTERGLNYYRKREKNDRGTR